MTTRKRILLLAAAGVAAVSIGAGFAFARTGSTAAIGSGIVVVDTKLGYQSSAAAGTGIVLTSSGEVLTNNHVINGSTSVTVVVPGTSHRYAATVVGYDRSADVAVLQLKNASNLKTAALGDSATVKPGDSVKARGNAGGTGTLSVSSGSVVGLGKSITAGDDQGGSERLTGLIETSVPLEPGDSGGPLLAGSGRVVGMNTATSTGFAFQAASAADSYAIPIDTALAVAKHVESGDATTAIHVGATAFLGVEVQPVATGYGFGYGGTSAGAAIAGVVGSGPAAEAGLTPGDVITAFAGHTVSSPTALTTLVLAQKPGAKVAVTYLDQEGTKHVTTVTLGSGPSQ
ncbi:MAG TPA: trypsin-like peptidase domain-containing protein [Gaiellaceae bacterium]|nr:trypsin-like peptidase domain-containing protein [Gaiellaceae bacterium]